jgi:hypothetical protein
MSLTDLINDNLKFAISQISVTLDARFDILTESQTGSLTANGTEVNIGGSGLDTSATHVRVTSSPISEYNGIFPIDSMSSVFVSYSAAGPAGGPVSCNIEVGTTTRYTANKQDVESGFEIFEDGREENIDTKFYIARSEYSVLPSKGEILSDGTTSFKVMSVHDDAVGVTRRLDCASEFQR